MSYAKVEDPNLLEALEKKSKKVTDPNLLAQLNAKDNEQYQTPETKGWAGIGEDIADLPGKALAFGLSIPEESTDSGLGWNYFSNKGQLKENPKRAAKNFIAGIGENAIGALNLPYKGLKYLGEKGVIPEWLKNYNETGLPIPFTGRHIPTHIPENLGFEEKVLGLKGNEPGDKFLRMMSAFGGAPKASSVIPGIGKEVRSVRKFNYKALKNKLEESGFTAEMADSALKAAESAAKREFNATNPDALHYKLGNTKEAIQEKAEQLAKPAKTEMPGEPPESFTGENPQPPEIPAHPELPPEHPYEPMAEKTESLLKTAEQKAKEAEAALNKHLGEGQTHHARFGKEVTKEREKLESANKEKYGEVDKDLESKNVTVKKESADTLMKKISKAISEHGLESKEVEDLHNQIHALGKGQTIPAKQFLKMYRTMRNQMYEDFMFAKENPNTEGGTKAYDRAKKLQEQEKSMYSLLKESMGPETFKKFEEAQAHFREKIAPMRQNTTFREIQKKGKVAGSILEKGIGDEIGQNILQEMIRNNPELQRLAVGQEFAGKVKNLYAPNEELQANYFPHMPELSDLMKAHQEATKGHEQMTALHIQAKAHDVAQEKIAKERTKERETISKTHEKKVADLLKSHDKAISNYQKQKSAYDSAKSKHENATRQYENEQEAREQLQKSHDKLVQRMESLEKTIPDLEKKAHAKKQSLEEKHKNMVAYEKAEADFKKMKTMIKKGGKLLIKVGKKINAL